MGTMGSRRERLLREIADRERALAALDEWGDNSDFEDCTVLQFNRTFCNHRTRAEACFCKVYNYLAVKAGGLWYTTGKERAPYGWERLVEVHLSKAIEEGHEVWIATEWESL